MPLATTGLHLTTLATEPEKKSFSFLIVPSEEQSLSLIGLVLITCLSLNQSLYRGSCSDWLGLARIFTLVRNEEMRNERGDDVL